MKGCRLLIINLVGVCLVALSSCATQQSSNEQTVSIKAIDQKTAKVLAGVNCTLTDGKGRIYPVRNNPGSITVEKGHGALVADCRKPNFLQVQVGIKRRQTPTGVPQYLYSTDDVIARVNGHYPSKIMVVMRRT